MYKLIILSPVYHSSKDKQLFLLIFIFIYAFFVNKIILSISAQSPYLSIGFRLAVFAFFAYYSISSPCVLLISNCNEQYFNFSKLILILSYETEIFVRTDRNDTYDEQQI